MNAHYKFSYLIYGNLITSFTGYEDYQNLYPHIPHVYHYFTKLN